MKNTPIPRLPDSVILDKFHKLGALLCQGEWRVDATGPNWQMFSVTAKKDSEKPWANNAVATQVAKSGGAAIRTFILYLDGRHSVQVARNDGAPNDTLNVDQAWFGGDEPGFLAYTKVCDAVGPEFVFIWGRSNPPAGVSPELATFVEQRDQSLARLEDLNTRFTREVFEERSAMQQDLVVREKELLDRISAREASLDEQFRKKEATLVEREEKLAAKLREVDDRDARFVRRQLRADLKKEIKDRQSKFELTKGTQRMRWPIVLALVALAAILGYGFYFYTLEIIRELAAPKPPEGFLLAILLVRQLLIGLGLGGTIWFFIHWQNQWSQRHAEEEFAVKRLELDLDRASWVVELAMEWSKEKQGHELPQSIARELTKNLFNERDARTSLSPRSEALTELLGASTQAELEAGNAKFKIGRSGVKKLQESLAGNNE